MSNFGTQLQLSVFWCARPQLLSNFQLPGRRESSFPAAACMGGFCSLYGSNKRSMFRTNVRFGVGNLPELSRADSRLFGFLHKKRRLILLFLFVCFLLPFRFLFKKFHLIFFRKCVRVVPVSVS